jgi:hypothetical protein
MRNFHISQQISYIYFHHDYKMSCYECDYLENNYDFNKF